MSGHPNHSSNTSQGGGYPSAAWSFNTPGFGASIPTATPTAGAGRPLPERESMFPVPSNTGQYATQSRNAFEASMARRRQAHPGVSARDRRNGHGMTERKRVVVACTRCRKRKIRCSGDDGKGTPCTNCSNATTKDSTGGQTCRPKCEFMRVQAGSLADMRQKEHNKRLPIHPSTFTYDLNTCRQYQPRGATPIGLPLSTGGPHAHSTSYGAPSAVIYNWTPGTAAGYGDNSGSGTGGMGYGMPYHGMPYHGMPSPDASYMGDNDLTDRPTSSMADAGAFALQSMSQGNSSGGSGGQHPYGGHGHNGHHATTSTPRSLPGPPSVLGSSRGVPPSSVFSAPRAAPQQQYPSPATTPITSDVSPVWTGYEQPQPQRQQSPYGSAPMPAGMAAQSLERLPDLYSATPPPPASAPAEGGVALGINSGGGSQHGGDESSHGDGGSSTGHHQSQQQPFGYDYADGGRGQAEGRGEGQQHADSSGRGMDMVGSHAAAAPGSY